jgi:hypothetical protein
MEEMGRSEPFCFAGVASFGWRYLRAKRSRQVRLLWGAARGRRLHLRLATETKLKNPAEYKVVSAVAAVTSRRFHPHNPHAPTARSSSLRLQKPPSRQAANYIVLGGRTKSYQGTQHSLREYGQGASLVGFARSQGRTSNRREVCEVPHRAARSAAHRCAPPRRWPDQCGPESPAFSIMLVK